MMIKYKRNLIIFVVALFITVLTFGIVLLCSDNKDEKTAYIYSEGELLYTINLDGKNDEFTINTDYGYNIICIKNGKIGITDADCPDKTCVKTGFTDSVYIPVICMPHRLEIVIKNGSLEMDGMSR